MMFLKRGRLAEIKPPPSNPNASPEARRLYARLVNTFGSRAGPSRPMFVGTNETAATAPYFTSSGQRFEELCGKHPLVKTFWFVGSGNPAYMDGINAVKEHHRKGGICATIWHPNNYLTGGNNYDRPRDDWAPVLACMSPSGSKLAEYRADLAAFAATLALCVDDDGKRIPFIVRIGNETNGWYDYPDMSVTSLTRSGTTATMHFNRGANTIGTVWSNTTTGKFQIRGASDSKWNTLFNISTWAADPDGNGGTVTFTVNTSPTSNPSGTITCNGLAGDWWAGADRSADVLALWRQTIDYLRDVQGCNQLIWSCDIYTDNRLAASMNPFTPGQEYSLWLDGMENYWDVVGSNLYQDEPLTWGYCDFGAAQVVNSFQLLADWATKYGRPVMFMEFGATYNGRSDPLFWSQKAMGAFDAKYPTLAGAKTWTPAAFLPTPGTPTAADFAVAMSNPRYVWRPQ